MNWNLRRRVSNCLLIVVAVAPWIWAGVVIVDSKWTESQVEDVRASIASNELDIELESDTTPIVSASQQRRELDKWRLQDRPTTARTMQDIEALGATNHVNVHSVLTPSSGQTGTQHFDVDVSGSTEQICGFIRQLENHERLMVVEAGKLFHDIGLCRAHLRIGTFHEDSDR